LPWLAGEWQHVDVAVEHADRSGRHG
jgi:hypothetical protein